MLSMPARQINGLTPDCYIALSVASLVNINEDTDALLKCCYTTLWIIRRLSDELWSAAWFFLWHPVYENKFIGEQSISVLLHIRHPPVLAKTLCF